MKTRAYGANQMYLPIEVVERDTASRVLVTSTSELIREEFLGAVCSDRDDTVDRGVERRVQGRLCVGHFSLDGELTVDV